MGFKISIGLLGIDAVSHFSFKELNQDLPLQISFPRSIFLMLYGAHSYFFVRRALCLVLTFITPSKINALKDLL